MYPLCPSLEKPVNLKLFRFNTLFVHLSNKQYNKTLAWVNAIVHKRYASFILIAFFIAYEWRRNSNVIINRAIK